MYGFLANDVDYAYWRGLELFRSEGRRGVSRAGEVLALPAPLTITYALPYNRVLFNPERDANPFFHLFESLWMLAGRNDATWLDQFVHDFSSRFAEDGGVQHGAYGYRWRNHFDMEGGGQTALPDQIETVIQLLKKDPSDRRAVLTMWDPVADLAADKKDVPCNLSVLPRVRGDLLDITVFCRSNDFVWGMTGANAVHFSVLQEYLAGRLGLRLGGYYQIANNAHVYGSALAKIPLSGAMPGPYPTTTCPMGNKWYAWDDDLRVFMSWTNATYPQVGVDIYVNSWFSQTAEPLFYAHHLWKDGLKREALEYVKFVDRAIAPDWRMACAAWMERRLARLEQKQEASVNESK